MTQLLTSLENLPSELLGGVVAVGNFDGVHRGHQVLIKRLVQIASELGGPALVMTFDPPPQAVLFPEREQIPPLTPIPLRAKLLGDLGVAALLAYPTDEALLSMSAKAFFERIIADQLAARAMVEGPNFRFGKDRLGDVRMLANLCQSANIKFEAVSPEANASGMISSSRIRRDLVEGDIQAATAMLGRSYEVTGVVEHGAGRGHDLGFATANLAQISNLLPARGVYAGRVIVGEREFAAAINIGPNPTFGESHDKLEVHVIGWNGELYEQALTCQITHRIRDLIKFETVDELKSQIAADIEACRQIHDVS